MLSEHIVISGHELDRVDMKGEWIFNCDYVFKNTVDRPISLKMGFPFPIRNEESENTAPAGYTLKKGSSLVHDFKVWVNGQLVTAIKSNVSPNLQKKLDYKEAYIWPMTFGPLATINVQHNYVTGITFNVVGHTSVSYVLKTGALWKGSKIGYAILEVKPNTPTRLCSEIEKDQSYLKPTPAGVSIVGEKNQRRYIWKLQNFTPTEDLNVCLMTGRNYIRYNVVLPIIQDFNNKKIDVSKLDSKQLWILRNTIFAQYGRHFKNSTLQEYFSKQWWYQPTTAYSDDLLTPEDKKALALITQAQARHHGTILNIK